MCESCNKPEYDVHENLYETRLEVAELEKKLDRAIKHGTEEEGLKWDAITKSMELEEKLQEAQCRIAQLELKLKEAYEKMPRNCP